MQIEDREVLAFYFGDAGASGSNEVHIGNTAIVMPLGRILLVRKGSDYCAIKFTKFWSENTSEVSTLFVAAGSDEYAMYESYYQGDKTGDFTKKNVQFKKEKLSHTKPRGIGRLAFSFGNYEIKCGTIKLEWFGEGGVSFYKDGIELAPTQWTDISQVNVFDPILRWYRYDNRRKSTNIPIDKLFVAPLPEKLGEDIVGQKDVYITDNAVAIPVGKIMLVRKGSKYCAVKFTNAWFEKKDKDFHYYVDAESYYQGDGSGDFSRLNVKFKKSNLFHIRPSIVEIGSFQIDCVKMILKGYAAMEANWIEFTPYLKSPGDYGIELAPTKWTDISQANVFDPRLKWYRYDRMREDSIIPIDQLWDDKESKK